MPLIIISGHPCTGKTTFSEQLVNKLKTLKDPEKIFLINEESLHLNREEFYQDATHEKMLRQSLKSAVDHSLNSNTYVILDSLNYIKGYRYELYCIARSQRTPHCVVQVDCTLETSLNWNTTENGTRWPLSILQDLRMRYEKPNEMNRWDKPLFYIDMTSQTKVTNQNQKRFNYESKYSSVSEDGEDLNQLSISSPLSPDSNSPPTPVQVQSPDNHNDTNNSIPLPPVPPNENSTSIETTTTTSSTTTTTSEVTTPQQTVVSSWKSKKKNSSTQSVVSQMTLNTKRENEQRGVYFSGNKVSDNEMLDESRSQNSNSIDQVIDDIINYFETAIAPAPNLATKPVRHAGPELLYQLDRVSQIIVQLITTHQQEHNDGTPLILKDFNSHVLQLPRYIGAQELQRLRRQFVKMNSAHPPENSVDVGGKFIEFLKTQIV